jgi:hypothetical protein
MSRQLRSLGIDVIRGGATDAKPDVVIVGNVNRAACRP